MSGMFQRFARRRTDAPDGASSPGGADGADTDAHDAPPAEPSPVVDALAHEHSRAPGDDATTKLIGVLGAPDGGEHATHGDAAPPQQPASGSTEKGSAVDQPTAAMPAAEQPTAEGSALSHALASATAPGTSAAAAQAGEAAQAAGATPEAGQQPTEPGLRRAGFRERGRMRRRLRYLRRVRELQVRDLGGLVFDLRRFERKRDDLVAQKIDQIRACDDELRALEQALDERRDVRDVRQPGIGGTCPRCFSLFGSTDRFCSHCGAALGGAAQGPAQVAPLRAPEPASPPPAGAPAPSAPAAPPPPRSDGAGEQAP
jgi:hypothetical protein